MNRHQPPKSWTALEAVENVAARLRNGTIEAKTMVISWSSLSEDGLTHEYVISNTEGLAAALGTLEMTKYRMAKSIGG